MNRLSITIGLAGAAFLSSTAVAGITRAPLGGQMFFACVAVAVLAYAVALLRIWHEPVKPAGALFLLALALAVAFRVPLAIQPVEADNDMVRYVWDGRIQHLGYNPYAVVPSDPRMDSTHTTETRMMPSRNARTPYPPGAQLFFRMVVGLHDSTEAMKLALLACDLLTILVIWRWLVATGRNEWLTLAYAWNPLVVFEAAYSGHIDVLGALWITACAYWLARKRTALAFIAFVLAVTTKFLPIVLLPLFWGRIRARDGVFGSLLFALLYLPFMMGGTMALGAVPNVIAHIRFNGPLFRAIALASTPDVAAAAALGSGLLLAAVLRWRLDGSNPAAWAWPMAVALAGSPVIYPWYLLYFTPFLFTMATVPLIVWTFSVFPVYLVWEWARAGARWVVPPPVLIAEYGVVVLSAAILVLIWASRRRRLPALAA